MERGGLGAVTMRGVGTKVYRDPRVLEKAAGWGVGSPEK